MLDALLFLALIVGGAIILNKVFPKIESRG